MRQTRRLTVTALLASTALMTQAAGQPAPTPPQAAPGQKPVHAERIVVNPNAVPKGENILPTARNSGSALGIVLNVMQTPRNDTRLSHAQLDALNIQDVHAFTYLTASSYSDSSFGGPNVPRIRGQYADVFTNGMRDSFTSNGYGAPLSFNSIDLVDIVKGPASVVSGPGPGVGGSVNLITKLPNFDAFSGVLAGEIDTNGHRRVNLDFGGPIAGTNLAYRISYEGEKSDSFMDGEYFDSNSIYAVVVAHPNDDYTIQLNSEAVYQSYKEIDGINRVNQQLIDSGLYLTGGPPASYSTYLTPVILGNPVKIGQGVNIDQTEGTSAHAIQFNTQLIQTWQIGADTSLSNNTTVFFLDRDNMTQFSYADATKDSFSVENKTDLKSKFDLHPAGIDIQNSVDLGTSFRVAHVNAYDNFFTEPVSTYDLTANPANWVFPVSLQTAYGNVGYTSPFGRPQYSTPGRSNGGATAESDLYDIGVFFEHRLQFTPQLSFLYGVRGDLVHANSADQAGGPELNGIPQSTITGWYGDSNFNLSPVYEFAKWGSAYVTYDYTQYVASSGSDGGVGLFGVPTAPILQQAARLYEAGIKLNLLDKKLFIGSAAFHQTRGLPTGPGGTVTSQAHINGFETELNYQPERHIFITASYSYIHTRLDTPASFDNYPAEPGVNYDGAGNYAVFLPGQKFNDPGVPQHIINFLGNYRFNSGFGLQLSAQVTGPIETSQSGWLDLAQSQYVPASIIAKGGYFQSPVIPWQYTLNASAFYDFSRYQLKLGLYNLTAQRNYFAAPPYYGNDFLVRADPFTVDFSAKVRF